MELEPLLERLEAREPAQQDAWPPTRSGRLAGRSVILAETGIGVAAAAAAVGVLAERYAPSACITVGIGGTYVGSFVPVGAAVCASEESFLDLGIVTVGGITGLESVPLPLLPGEPPSFGRVPTDPSWSAVLAGACGTAPVPFATSDAVSGDLETASLRSERSGAAVESMEGAAAALACLRLGLPFAELRGISNVAGQRDKAAWEIPRAIRASSRALLEALPDGPT